MLGKECLEKGGIEFGCVGETGDGLVIRVGEIELGSCGLVCCNGSVGSVCSVGVVNGGTGVCLIGWGCRLVCGLGGLSPLRLGTCLTARLEVSLV